MKARRLDKGVSQDACARALGYSDSTAYNKRETGATQITLEELAKLRDFLEAPRWWPLISEEDAYRLSLASDPASKRLEQYFAEHNVSPEIREEMQRRIRGDAAEWDDEDLDTIAAIAKRHLRRRAETRPQPAPPSAARPVGRKAGGGP